MQSTTNLSTYLSLSIWVPIIFGLIVLAVGRDSRAGMVRVLSLAGSLVSLLPTIPLITQFDTQAHGMQCLGDGGDLGEDVDAVFVLVNHPGDAADLPFDPLEPAEVRVLVGRVAVLLVG